MAVDETKSDPASALSASFVCLVFFCEDRKEFLQEEAEGAEKTGKISQPAKLLEQRLSLLALWIAFAEFKAQSSIQR